MATITVKNVPPELYEHVKRSAGANHRSINREIIACLERALGSPRLDPETFLARERQLRETTRKRPVTDAQFTKAKSAGRA
jgi:plasmid stability protein